MMRSLLAVAAVAATPALARDDAPPLPCSAGDGGTAVSIEVDGFRDRAGGLRVQLYGDRPEDFLAKGKKLDRIDAPVTVAGPMHLCVPLPGPGTYAIVVLHDRNANHRLDVWSDGVGFSRNPRLRLAKPAYGDVVFEAGAGTQRLEIVLNYRQGLTVRPFRDKSR